MDRDTGNTGHMTQRNRNQKKTKDNKNDKEHGLTKKKTAAHEPKSVPTSKNAHKGTVLLIGNPMLEEEVLEDDRIIFVAMTST